MKTIEQLGTSPTARTFGWIAGAAIILLATSLVSAHAADSLPDQAVRDATGHIQQLIKDRHQEFSRDPGAFYATVDQVVAPAFDVAYIAQLTLGKHWRSATAEQRDRFQAAFRNTLIHAYSDALLEYSESSRVEWQRSKISDDQATVHASVVRPSAPPTALRFDLHRAASGAWLAYDISVEGISLLTSFRSQFASEVKKDGLDALIQRLDPQRVAAH